MEEKGISGRRRHAPRENASFARSGSLEQRKAYHYILQLTSDDVATLVRYQHLLVPQATTFAEVLYNYLFDLPEAAQVLYAFEKNGGDAGGLVKTQLQHFLGLLGGLDNDIHPVGKAYFQHGFEPAWIIGAYRLYLNHILEALQSIPEIRPGDHEMLRSALAKRIFLDLGLILQAYWDESMASLQDTVKNSEASHARMVEMLANIPQLLWSVETGTLAIVYASPSVSGFANDEAEGPVPVLKGFQTDDRERILVAWEQAMRGKRASVEARSLPGAGAVSAARWYRLMFYPYPENSRSVQRVDAIMEDIDDQRATLERLEHLATTDELTGLANRTLWYDRANQALAAARRNGSSKVVLMLLDLDNFKLINDTLGHPAGDELLASVATRLRHALRDSDTLARLGGDEFAVLLPRAEDDHKAGSRVAETIQRCLQEHFLCRGHEFYLGASIGIAIYPEHGDDIDTLLSRADVAMYRAKNSGQGYLFYDPGKDSGTVKHLQLSGQLRRALDRGEFELHYQPKVAIGDDRVSGVEALLRWRHPEHGLIEPDGFIRVAEQAGLMNPITNWVLHTALHQCKSWWSGGRHIPISVNVSARSFQTPDLFERIQRALQETGAEGACLEIEITEDTLMSDLEHGSGILSRLSEEHVGVAIDDFGTGYSSLAYLKRLPIDTLKIDRSFLLDMVENENDAVLVRSIIDLGHNLGYQVVAEGVEDAEVWNLLDILGCDAVQGYHISRPLPYEAFTRWLQESRWH